MNDMLASPLLQILDALPRNKSEELIVFAIDPIRNPDYFLLTPGG